MTLVYSVILLTALSGFASLGVDFARVQVAKTQLLRAADAAARASASQLSNGVTATQNAAVTWAGYNTADGSSVVIDPNNDVDFGTWDSSARTFTVLSGGARSGANAVRVWARRTAAGGNAIPLTFGKVLGASSCDTTASAIALATSSGSSPGIVGINTMNLNQNSSGWIDSYDSSKGVYSGSNSAALAVVASNSNINLNSSTISGDVHPGVGKSISGSGYYVSGSQTALTSSLSYTAVTVGSYNNAGLPGTYFNGTDFSISSGVTVTIPAGTYYVRNFTLNNNCTLQASGAVIFYVYGALNFNNCKVYGYQHHPGNFQINFVSGATMLVRGNASVEGDFYGPAITFTCNGTSYIFGRVICNNLQQSSANSITQDTFLTGSGSGSTVSSVR
jgi:hypothetical protein